MEKKNKEISARFEQLIEALGETRYSFAKGMNNQYQVINNVCNGRNAPSFELLNKIALSYPNVNLVWLITGQGKIFSSLTDKKENSILIQKINKIEESLNELTTAKKQEPEATANGVKRSPKKKGKDEVVEALDGIKKKKLLTK